MMAEVGRRLLWVPAPWGQVVRAKGTREHHGGVLGLKKVPLGHWRGVMCKEYPSVAKEVGCFEEGNLLFGLQSGVRELQSRTGNRKKYHALSKRNVKSLGQVTGVLGELVVGQQERGSRKQHQGALSRAAGIPEESGPSHWRRPEGAPGHELDAPRVLCFLLRSCAASDEHRLSLSSSPPGSGTARTHSVISDSTGTIVGAAVHPAHHGFLTAAFRECSIAPCTSSKLSSSTRGGFSAAGHHNVFTRVYSTSNGAGRNNGAQKEPLLRSPTAYYDILGVTGSATQSQIKTAYYRQSFRFHPDRNNGDEEAALRFTEISEAYLILGSVALRKKYDRGTLSQEDVRAAGKPSVKVEGSTAAKRTQSMPGSSRYTPTKPVFDFDEFYRAHYGEQLEREQYMRWRREVLQRRRKGLGDRWQLKKLSEVAVLMLICSAALILFSFK
ncbi:hypothetical protein NDU88_001777 [Pleurodeles waltl]|uniref:J domain-containing protein n=1 Tax=Pleurodeles waltl TaxID=8319 RepID=A0AAV7U8K7_PLEWA|nr:hypothetical protein NDU88_001777 [Pleurodeles waltl]